MLIAKAKPIKKTYSLTADFTIENSDAPKTLRMPISLVRATIKKMVMPIIPNEANKTAMILK